MSKDKIFSKIVEIEAKRTSEQLELSKQAIELGIPEDLAKQTDAMKAAIKEINANIKVTKTHYDKYDELTAKAKEAEAKAWKAGEVLEKADKNADKLINQADKAWDKLKKAADNLGVDPSQIKGYKEWDKTMTDLMLTQREAGQYY